MPQPPAPSGRGQLSTPTASPRPLSPLSTPGAHAHLGEVTPLQHLFRTCQLALDLWNETVSASPVLRNDHSVGHGPEPSAISAFGPSGPPGALCGLSFPRGQPPGRFQALGSRPGKAGGGGGMDGWERPGEGAHSTPAPPLLTGTVWGTSTRLHISGLFLLPEL